MNNQSIPSIIPAAIEPATSDITSDTIKFILFSYC